MVILIFRTKCGGQLAFLLQNLQMQHYDCRNSKHPCQQVAVHEQYADILQVETQKRRISAVPVNTIGNEFRPVFLRDPSPPTVLHAEDRNQKNQISEHGNAKPGKASSCGQMAPTKQAENDTLML